MVGLRLDNPVAVYSFKTCMVCGAGWARWSMNTGPGVSCIKSVKMVNESGSLKHVAGLDVGHGGHTFSTKDVNVFDIISEVCLETFLDDLRNEVLTRVRLEEYCNILCENSLPFLELPFKRWHVRDY